MEFVRESKSGVEIFRFQGRLVIPEVKEVSKIIEPVLKNESVSKILFDLKKLEFIDSSGIGFLVICFNIVRKRNAKLGFCDLNEFILDIFTSTHLDSVLSIYTDENEAISKL